MISRIRQFTCVRGGMAIACVGAAQLALMAATVLDFENLPAGTTITGQYVRAGVLFKGAHLAADPNARSGTRVLRSVSPSAEVFTPIPLPMSFVKPQARIKLYAASVGSALNGTLRVFDAAGAVIGQDGPKLVAAGRFTTMFEVILPAPRIRRAELRLDGGSHYAIDDLEFDSAATPEQPPPARLIEMRQPSVRDNRVLRGRLPREFKLGRAPDADEIAGRDPGDPEDEAEERFAIEFAPAVERDLAPGAVAEVSVAVSGKSGLAGSARWIGTTAALETTLAVNGSRLASGKPYAIGTDRGGADAGGVAPANGTAVLSVSNTSKVPVRVRLTLAVIPGGTK